MMRFAVLVLSLAGLAAPAGALTFEGCEKTQPRVVEASVAGARDMVLRAAANVGNNGTYVRWFGAYDPDRAETVRATFKSIVRTLSDEKLHVQCLSASDIDCSDGSYAFVYGQGDLEIFLCPPFFGMPPAFGLTDAARNFDNGSREGTIIHEISHFQSAGATEDNCYGREVCSALAKTDPGAVIENADSFQYFTEDMVRALQAGTP